MSSTVLGSSFCSLPDARCYVRRRYSNLYVSTQRGKGRKPGTPKVVERPVPRVRCQREEDILAHASAHSSRRSQSGQAALTTSDKSQHKGKQRWPHLGVLLSIGLVAMLLYSPAQALAKAFCNGSCAATSFSFTGAVKGLLDFILHLDKHLSIIIAQHGKATYAFLFAIVFAETGFVLTPFLPGDSLLFAAGAFAALGSLNVWALSAVFITAAILGDAVNYAIGNYLGAKALESNIIKKEYIAKTEEFYRKHGGKTVVLARFVPIVRTFAPFVAGVGSMPYSEFGMYNVGGALLWTFLFVGAGFFFGNLDFVRHNFTLVVVAIVAVSVLPIVFEVIAARREASSEGQTIVDDPTGSSAVP